MTPDYTPTHTRWLSQAAAQRVSAEARAAHIEADAAYDAELAREEFEAMARDTQRSIADALRAQGMVPLADLSLAPITNRAVALNLEAWA